MRHLVALALILDASGAYAHAAHEAHIHGAGFVIAFIAIALVVCAMVQAIRGTR